MTDFIIITNNSQVAERYESIYSVEYYEMTLKQILLLVRDRVHLGHVLLTHPLAGSIKPNETPFKSVLISRSKGQTDLQSVRIIEESIETCEKFHTVKFPNMSQRMRDDFGQIDLSLIENALESAVEK